MNAPIEAHEYKENGYKTLVTFDKWRVAFMNDGPKTTVDGLTYFQKHDETDEVFILLGGRCVLLLADFGDKPSEIINIANHHFAEAVYDCYVIELEEKK